IKPIGCSARLDDPVATSISCPDDGPMETNSRPVVCIGKREPKEVVPLRQWVLPNPLRLGVNQRFVATLMLSQRQRCHIGEEKKDAEQIRTLKVLLLNCSGLSIHCGFPLY